MTQLGLLAPPPAPPKAVVEFLAAFTATAAFGEKPTAEQKRQAHAVAVDCAERIYSLRPPK